MLHRPINFSLTAYTILSACLWKEEKAWEYEEISSCGWCVAAQTYGSGMVRKDGFAEFYLAIILLFIDLFAENTI